MTERIDIPSQESLVTQISSLKSNSSECRSQSSTSNHASRNAAFNQYNLCEYNISPDMLNRSFNVTLKFLSPGASSGPFCRICHEGDNLEDLVSLCKCTGSMGLVHLTCMERWLSTRRFGPDDKCEICDYTFEIVRSPRSITEWYHSDQGALSNRRNFLGDAACFSMITPLTTISSYLCFEGAKQHVIWNNSLEAGCLIALATFLITVYLVWNVLTIRYHLKSYFTWRAANQNVRLVGYRRHPSATNPSICRGNTVRTTEDPENGDSLAGLVTNNHQTSSHQSPSEANNVNIQASNLCSRST